MTTRIQLRRDTAIRWTSINPVLAAGEPAVESDTGKLKVGDGTSVWSVLPYILDVSDLAPVIEDLVAAAVPDPYTDEQVRDVVGSTMVGDGDFIAVTASDGGNSIRVEPGASLTEIADAVSGRLSDVVLSAAFASRAGARLAAVPRIPPAPIAKMFSADTTDGAWQATGSAGAINVNATLSSTTYTGNVLLGTKSIRVVSNGNGGFQSAFPYLILNESIDATNYDIRYWFWLNAADTVQSINVDLRDSTNAARSNNYYLIGGITDLSGFAVQPGRWNVVDLPMSALAGPANLADIKTIQITMTDGAGKPFDTAFAGIAFTERAHTGLFQNGVMSITADDCSETQWTILRPLLDKYGWRATLFPIIDQIGAPGNLTLAQVRSLHDDYGWEIGAHALTGVSHGQGIVSMTQAQRLAEFEQIKAWGDQYGFDSPSYAYPLGSHSQEAERDVARYFSVGRQATISHIGPQHPQNPYALQTVNAGYNAGSVEVVVPQVATGKGWGSMLYHAIQESGGTGNDVTSATLAFQLSVIDFYGLTVLPMGDVIRTLAA